MSICVRATEQKYVTKSSTEADLGLNMRNFMKEQGHKMGNWCSQNNLSMMVSIRKSRSMSGQNSRIEIRFFLARGASGRVGSSHPTFGYQENFR